MVRALQVLLLALVVTFVVSTIPGVRSGSGFDALLDGWLQGSAYVLCAGLAVLRPVTSHFDRVLWTLVAAALVSRAVAFVVYLGIVRNLDPVPYPSVSDVFWLATCLLLLLALGLRVRSYARGSPSPWCSTACWED